MSDNHGALLYHPIKALNHAQTISGLHPERLFPVLYPIWHVEVHADREEGRPYELIERYLERGILEGGIKDDHDLATFFGLDHRLVLRVLDFLETIGHVRRVKASWELTDLGRRSIAEGRTLIPKKALYTLYFDGFTSTPLYQEHYSKEGGLKSLTADQVGKQIWWYGQQFRPFTYLGYWRSEVLQHLEIDKDRNRFNLPTASKNLRVKEDSVFQVYIPLYIIQARKDNGVVDYLVYSHIKGLRDTYFEDYIKKDQQTRQIILTALQSEQTSEMQKICSEWLKNQGLPEVVATTTRSGSWRISLPSEVFRRDHKAFQLTRMGNYELSRGYFFQIWCDETNLRRLAVMDKVLKLINPLQQNNRQKIEEDLQRISQQLDIGQPGPELSTLLRRAEVTGQKQLVQILKDV